MVIDGYIVNMWDYLCYYLTSRPLTEYSLKKLHAPGGTSSNNKPKDSFMITTALQHIAEKIKNVWMA